MNATPRTSETREPRTRRTVSRWEVIAGLMILAIPLEAVAFVGVKGIIEGGPCDDGQVLAAKVDERGFVVLPDAEIAPPQTFCRDFSWDEGYQAEEKIWINPQGNVHLKCHADFGLREIKVIHAESEAAGYGKYEKASETPEACQILSYEVPEHWAVIS